MSQVLTSDELGKSVNELISLGCKFVVDGEVFGAMIEFIEKLLVDSNPDKAAEQYLLNLRGLLLQTSKPVKERLNQSEIIRP